MKRALWTGAINSARTCNRQTFDGRNVGMMAGSPEACTQEELFHRQLRGRLREGHARATRKIRRSDSWIPTLFQGRGILDDVLLQVRLDTLRDDFNNGRFTLQKRGKVKFTGPLYELRVEDGALDEYGNEMPACRVGFERARVLAHNMIIHPMSSLPVGLLLRYSPENEPVRVRVPLRFINQEKSSGLRVGGWLNRIHSAVDINVAAGIKAPLFVTADVGNMKMKDKFPIGQLMFDGKGQGCKTVLNDDVTCIIMSKA